jgi:hypothetical protein
MFYYTGLNIPAKRLIEIIYRDYNKWQRAKQSIQKFFPMNDENILKESEAPAIVVAQKAFEVLSSISVATAAVINANNLSPIKKRKHTKPLSEVGAKYQRKLVGGIISDLTAEYKDTIDNILLTILLVISRPHAIKIALQLEGVNDELSVQMIDKLKFTPEEMVTVMVYTISMRKSINNN